MLDVPALLEFLGAWRLEPPVRVVPVERRGTTSYVWRVEASSETYAAKLVLDRPPFVEPGLRVALAVAAAGIPTGEPVATPTGALTVPVSTADAGTCTLALLRWYEGQPLDAAAADAPRLAGDLLGRVHAALLGTEPQLVVPGDLLRWFGGFLAEPRRIGARGALADANRLVAEGLVTMGIVYGDPAPEILVGDEAPAALIDWGTPSYGPLLHDVAAWSEAFASDEASRTALRSAYIEHNTLQPDELARIGPFVTLARVLRDA